MAERIGIYVLGMHRSGTSALARVIDLLGVPLADRGMVAPSDDNPAGYWEPQDLVIFNMELLQRLGGRTMAPPPLEISAHSAHLLREHIPAARALFRSLHSGEQWAWKDPRNCLLLPFWRAALDDRPVVVLAYRDPSEVAASLHGRGSVVGAAATSLWENHVRSAMFVSQGVPGSSSTTPISWLSRNARLTVSGPSWRRRACAWRESKVVVRRRRASNAHCTASGVPRGAMTC